MNVLYECHKADILLTHDGGGQSAWEDVTDHFGIAPPHDGKRLWLVYEHQPLNYPSLYCWLKWLDNNELKDRLDQLHDWTVVRRRQAK